MKEELHFNTATIHGGQSPDKKAQESTRVLNIVVLTTLLEKH